MEKWEAFKITRDEKLRPYLEEERKKLDHHHTTALQEGWKYPICNGKFSNFWVEENIQPFIQAVTHFHPDVNERYYIQSRAEQDKERKKQRYTNYLLSLHKKKMGWKK